MRYDSRVEEVRSIKRRTRRDQIRLLLLIKEAEIDGDLEKFAADIDMVLATTKNYLAAYERYVELELLPAAFDDADDVKVSEVVYDMWGEMYDYTLNTQRYDSVDPGVKEMAEEMGLKGFGKAMDIAKNPKSMTAAILGDRKASDAALAALTQLAESNPTFRQQAALAGFVFVPDRNEDSRTTERPRMSFWTRQIIAINDVTASTQERAFEDENVPWGLIDACEEGSQRLLAVSDLLKGRHQMNEVQ